MEEKEKEQLKKDLELIFTYARCHSTNINPHSEQELIHIINIKQEVFNLIFNKKTEKK